MKIPSSVIRPALQNTLSNQKTLWLATGLGLGSIPLKLYSFNKAFELNGFSPNDKKLLMTQEWARQLVSSGLWIGSLVASWGLSKRLFPQQKALFHLLSANAMSSVVDIVARPFATAKLTHWFMGNQPITPAKTENTSQPSKTFTNKGFTGYDGYAQYNYWV